MRAQSPRRPIARSTQRGKCGPMLTPADRADRSINRTCGTQHDTTRNTQRTTRNTQRATRNAQHNRKRAKREKRNTNTKHTTQHTQRTTHNTCLLYTSPSPRD
eukprot:13024855-Alexandrium_andersonii.AAC.1